MNMNLRTAPTQEALADGAADYAIIKSAEAIVAVKPVGAKLVARLGSLLSAWWNRRQVARLYAFDERILRDIGLTRSDVAGALALPVKEDPSLRLANAARERRDARRWARREFEMHRTIAALSPPPNKNQKSR